MRAPDGLIFEMEQVSESDRRLLQVTSLMTAARTAFAANDEATAVDKLKQVLALDATHADASALLRDIARQKELAELYDSARAKLDAGQFADALDPLHRLQSLDRGYRDVAALVAMAEKAIAQKSDADARVRRPRGTASRCRRLDDRGVLGRGGRAVAEGGRQRARRS
jgi:tetratricopeptide (TPR) repeat protein